MKKNSVRLVKKYGAPTVIRALESSVRGEGPNMISLCLNVTPRTVNNLIDAGRELVNQTANFAECFLDA